MASDTPFTRYTRLGRKVSVRGFWAHRGGCLWLGEVSVMTAKGIMRFSSTTQMAPDSLAMYASGNYLARFADRFKPRPVVYA
jgi:hypothetical protein